MTNDEVVAFDRGYKLGFRAGRLERCRYSIAMLQYSWAITGGISIALKRGNISLEEYERIVESHDEEAIA